MDSLPEQDELRRRLRAARALRDLTVERLAEKIPAELRLGVRTLRKLESGERDLTETVCRQLAEHIDVPYAWFTVPDVGEAVSGLPSSGGSFGDRLAALEDVQAKLLAEIRAGRRGPVVHEPPSVTPAPTRAAAKRRGQAQGR